MKTKSHIAILVLSTLVSLTAEARPVVIATYVVPISQTNRTMTFYGFGRNEALAKADAVNRCDDYATEQERPSLLCDEGRYTNFQVREE